MSESVYTDTVVGEMVQSYKDVLDKDYATRSAVVQAIAEELGQTVASVRSKLVAEKVYVAKEAASSSAKGITKEEYVKALEAMTGTTLASFAKASKKDLKAMVEYITNASNQKEADEGQ